jgi:DNA-binding NtrC family response regulator
MSRVKILIVEDLTTDAELAKREISRELDACEYRVVESEKEYLSALDRFDPDVIISDYMLPHFDGMKALKLAADKRPETPFIVVTGSMNEDTAVHEGRRLGLCNKGTYKKARSGGYRGVSGKRNET